MTRRIRRMCLSVSIAIGATAPLPAFADCAAQIVIGKHGDFDVFAYFNRAQIASAAIPTAPGAKYQCTFEGPYGMIDQANGLNANEFIQSVGNGWRRDGDAYACQLGVGDCSFVIQRN